MGSTAPRCAPNYRESGGKFPALARETGARASGRGAPERDALRDCASQGGSRYWIGQYTRNWASSAAVSAISDRYSS